MNNIDTSQISDPNTLQPFLGPSLAFLQSGNKEIVKGMVYATIGDSLYNYSINTSRGVVVAGCIKSGSGNTIFNGFIFYGGEVYYFPGASGLNSYSDVPVFLLDEINDGAIDPVQFSDLTMKSVHKIRRLKVADQVSGTGLWDMSLTGRIVEGAEVVPALYVYNVAGTHDVPSATFTSPNRVCDMEITFNYDAFMVQVGAALVGIEVYLTATAGVQKTKRHLIGMATPTMLMTVEHSGSLKKIYKNCPANSVIKIQVLMISGTAGVDGVELRNMTYCFREVIKPNLW